MFPFASAYPPPPFDFVVLVFYVFATPVYLMPWQTAAELKEELSDPMFAQVLKHADLHLVKADLVKVRIIEDNGCRVCECVDVGIRDCVNTMVLEYECAGVPCVA